MGNSMLCVFNQGVPFRIFKFAFEKYSQQPTARNKSLSINGHEEEADVHKKPRDIKLFK